MFLSLNCIDIPSYGIDWLLGRVKESVMFMLAYLPLRRMADGYCARTQLSCYIWGIVLANMEVMEFSIKYGCSNDGNIIDRLAFASRRH